MKKPVNANMENALLIILCLRHQEGYNGEVDAGERQHEPIKSTTQVEKQAIEPRVQRFVGVRRHSSRLIRERGGGAPTLHLLSTSRAAFVSEPGAVAMGSSRKFRLDRVATAPRSDTA